jgi:trans-aconitate 2-methyltransferase
MVLIHGVMIHAGDRAGNRENHSIATGPVSATIDSMNAGTWSPEQYLKFKRERTQPSRDLVARIALDSPRRVIDVGCGPGNSTEVLRQRWPGAEITGLDSSAEMIADARSALPEGLWVQADAATFEPEARYDLVFSNAALQWIPDHETLIPRLLEWINDDGVLAMQLPANHGSPIHRALLDTAASEPFAEVCAGCGSLLEYRTPGFYYDLLAARARRVEMWESIYYHEMPDHSSLIEWYKSTGMKPYLARLSDDASRSEFEAAVLERVRPGYPLQQNGRLLYPFRRLFVIAYL